MSLAEHLTEWSYLGQFGQFGQLGHIGIGRSKHWVHA